MATISFTTQFNLSTTPKKFVFVDTSDYAGQGISTSNVNGCFKITSPSGIVIYNNTDFSNSGCDVRVSVSTTNQTIISLPLLLGVVEPGVYSIIYTVKDITSSPVFYTVTNSYTYLYVAPVVCISQIVDEATPLFTSIDTTSYPIAGTTYVLSRVHTLYYPWTSAGAGSPTISSSQTIPVSVFYNGTQTTTIASTLTYTFTDGLVVYDIITGSQEIVVSNYDMCSMLCCVKTMAEQLETYKLTDTAQYNLLLPQFNLVMSYRGLIQWLIECGQTSNILVYINLIKEIAHCTDACSDCGADGTQVIGMGITNLDVVVEEGVGTSVTPSVVGSTTTYTVSLGSSWITLINSLYNTVVTPGYGIGVTASGIIANVQTYTAAAVLVPTVADTPYSSPFTIPSGPTTDTIVTGLTATAPTTGTYLIFAEADFNIQGHDSALLYRLVKNTTTKINSDRTILILNEGATIAVPYKMYCHTSASLIAGDTIKFSIDNGVSGTSGATITGRSIILLRIA